MNRGKLLIALVVAGVLCVGLGASAVPASAELYKCAGIATPVPQPVAGVACVVIPSTTTTTASPATGSSTAAAGTSAATTEIQPSTAASTQTSTGTTQTGTTGTTTATTPDDTPDDEPAGGGKKGKGKTKGKSKTPKNEGSSKDSDSTPGNTSAPASTTDGRGNTTVQPDGQPALTNPTTTIADVGPAPIGVPNFVIDRFKIPPFLLPIYKAAEAQYNIPWQVLAAVNEIETNYGQNLNVSSAGAVGWMQFLPSTWKSYGVDANGDGRRDPYNPVDAIFGAARYIKAAGGEKDIRKGLFAYNPANWYVDSVLLRAKVIGGLPADLVGSLTQIVEGRFPVAAKARYADQLSQRAATQRVARSSNASIPVSTRADRNAIDIFSESNAPVIAVNDGTVAAVGTSKKRGRYVVLKDYAGNRYTYSQLGSVVTSYPAPKDRNVTQGQIRDELNLPRDPKPTQPASAGAQRSGARATSGRTPTGGAAKQTKAAAAQPRVSVTKERLFANPTRPNAYRNGGRDQVAATSGKRDFETYGAYFAKVFGLGRNDVQFKALRKGAQVVAGTVLGRMGVPEQGKAPYISFGIQPAGDKAPKIDPKPILDGWKLLESTAIYRAAGKNPFLDQKSISVGQMMLMTKEQLGRSVLGDPRIDIYSCGRQDIQGGLIDRRVLIVLKYLAGSGLKPTVSALKCGHSKFVAGGGRVSDHWYGRAVDVAAINGIPILGNQQDGGIADITIRRLLLLRGFVKPSQIISLRTYQGFDNTLALSDHDDHIHVGFSAPGGASSANPGDSAVLKPGQWTRLIDRLGKIQNPTVPIKPSKFSVANDPTGTAKRGD